jgi:hypothetical protein
MAFNPRVLSQILEQFFESDAGLFQNGLQSFRFDLPMHRDTGMKWAFAVLAM